MCCCLRCNRYITVRSASLLSGNTKNCGSCYTYDMPSDRAIKNRKSYEGKVINNCLVVEYDHQATIERIQTEHNSRYKFKCLSCGRLFSSVIPTVATFDNGCSECSARNKTIKRRERKAAKLIGQKSHQLTVVGVNHEASDKYDHGDIVINCRCDCGNMTTCTIYEFTHKQKKSCGCLGVGWSSEYERAICQRIYDKYKHIGQFLFNPTSESRNQLMLCNKDTGNRFFYDLTIKLNNGQKLIFECNGTMFHAKTPDQMAKDGTPWKSLYSGHSAEYCYNYDMLKKQTAEQNGYKVFYVWDDNTVDQCVDQISAIIDQHLL